MPEEISLLTLAFDVIVIGVGSMGSAACYYLSKRGHKVLGLEQFDIPHEKGAHSGQSRIIRKAYFEHSDYVPLLARAYENWKALEEETESQIYFRTGLVYAGKPSSAVIEGIKKSSSLYKIELEKLGSAAFSKLLPQISIPSHYEIWLETEAGFVTPEKAILSYTELAIKNNASIHSDEKVIEWKREKGGIKVTTDKNTYWCNKLIITAGAWSGKMIPGYDKKIKVTRQYIAWVKPKRWQEFELGNFPCWLFADDERENGVYYGFPILPASTFNGPIGLKVAHAFPAQETNPDQVDRNVSLEDEENIKWVMNKYFPGIFESVLFSKTCLYANSPDENFIIDKLPGYDGDVIIACGFSGHGFKFASAVGEILTDLAIEGTTSQPIEFLSAERFH